MKLTKKSTLLLAVGLVIALVLGGTGWIAFKILTRPGPKQLAEAQEAAMRAAMSEDQREAEELQGKAEKLMAEIEKIPPFQPPADTTIPADRMAKYAENQYAQIQAMNAIKATQKPGTMDIGTGITMLQRIYFAVQGAHATKLIEHKMSPAEYDWISTQILKAEIIALARLDKMTTDPEAKKKIAKFLSDLAISLGIYVADDRGFFTGQWEKIDPATVPEQNVRYIVQYSKKLGFDPVWIDQLDWSPLAKEMGITPVE